MKDIIQIMPHARTSNDLFIFNCGYQKCAADHSYGPRINDYYLIHFLLSGKGTFIVNEKNYPICQGQAFIIFPSDYYNYSADPTDPYEYVWVGFHGANATNLVNKTAFSKNNAVLNIEAIQQYELLIKKIIESSSFYSEEKNIEALGYLYILISKLISVNEHQENNGNKLPIYIMQAVQYIHQNFHNDIQISDICKQISLNRTYFTTMFKHHMDISPYNYLINFRIDQACRLLLKTSHTVSEISTLVGFKNHISFTLCFKKKLGMSPSMYRKINST